jgi:CheY-like chemotaxis protein
MNIASDHRAPAAAEATVGRILVVEDDPDIRFSVGLALELAGHQIVEAATGEAALELLAGEPVDLVLLDLRLPGMDGWAVLEHLAAQGRFPEQAVIVLSAYADPELQALAVGRGCRGSPDTPSGHDRLLARVAAVLHGDDAA